MTTNDAPEYPAEFELFVRLTTDTELVSDPETVTEEAGYRRMVARAMSLSDPDTSETPHQDRAFAQRNGEVLYVNPFQVLYAGVRKARDYSVRIY